MFKNYGWKPSVRRIKRKILSSINLMWYCLLCCARWLEFLGTVDEMLVCDHSNVSYCTVFSCGTCTRWLNHTLFCGWNPCVWSVKWELSGDLKVEKHQSLYTETVVKNENIACLDFNWHRQRLQKPIKFKEFFLHSNIILLH